MTKKPKHKLYDTAEYMFIEEMDSCKAISETIDIPERTLSVWRGKMEWDKRREENLAAPHKIRSILLKELSSIAAGNKPKVDTNALSQVSKVITTMDGTVMLNVVISVFKEFDNWMRMQDHQTAISFLEWHKKFILHRAKIESNK
ncbi:hypothetical protein KTO58_19800 [Chitinophaga pendula]|uniref:hypothetical protein n=1 Tax=Chitinophaga TaxID=79328 RepID=UPI000BB037BF|nr:MULTISPECIES: hypothetical protein [Chitinophaga]ASZ11088.1 hypothetical protein CK934_09000 [Chitinophaga sp. MD30]UCJ05915.1 hypothetical protein KTO58_19800 [Chitinophaga pendula]